MEWKPMKKTEYRKRNNGWKRKGHVSNTKRFMVTIPDESVFIAMSREMSFKHDLNPKESLQILALEYCFNPSAREMIDRILKNRWDQDSYPNQKDVKKTVHEQIQIPEPNPKDLELKPWQVKKIDGLRTDFYKTREKLKNIDPNQPEHKKTMEKAENLLEERINAIWD